MVRVTFWVQYLFALLMLRQTDALSDHSSELDKVLGKNVTRIMKLKQKNEVWACQCQVSAYYAFHVPSLGYSYM